MTPDSKPKTQLINLRNCSRYDIRIDRQGPFGNPFRIGTDGDRNRVCDLHNIYFLNRIRRDTVFRKKVLALDGLRLGCWCVPLRCHGHNIIRWLEEQKKQPQPH